MVSMLIRQTDLPRTGSMPAPRSVQRSAARQRVAERLSESSFERYLNERYLNELYLNEDYLNEHHHSHRR